MSEGAEGYPERKLLAPPNEAVVSAGKIHMLGLESIKERLGPKWDRMSILVHRYFEAAIRREMAPGDTFAHTSELSYIVLFRGTTIAETQLKCSIIAKEVCKRLFGDDDDDVSVRSLTLPVDDVDLNEPDVQAALNNLLEREGKEALYYVKEAREERPSKVLRVRLDIRSEQYHSLPSSKPNFLYRPIWDSVRGVVLTYLCQALPTTASSAMVFSGFCVADDESDQALLDESSLLECLYRSRNLRNAGLRVQFAVPIHFTTLARGSNWRKFSALRHRASPELLRDLAFFVHGIDPDVPNIRLTSELPKLGIISKRIFCLIEDPSSVNRQFRNTGIYAVGLNYRAKTSETDWMAKLSTLSGIARDAGFETFALGSILRSTAVSAIGAGARFVEGAGVRRPVADPKYVYVHEIDDLYRDAGSVKPSIVVL